MNRTKERELNRREFISKSMTVISAVPAAGAVFGLWGCTRSEEKQALRVRPNTPTVPNTPPTPSPGQEVTQFESNQTVLQALKYVSNSPKTDQRCEICSFYAPDATSPGMGKCQLIPAGLVRSGGWCTSYQPKQAKT